MNRITVIGRLVRDTELKEVGDGRIVMNNTIAIARPFKTEAGPDVDFLNFVAWGKRAEIIEEYCDKGDMVGLDGRIQSRTYQNNQKDTVYITEMNVESVYFLQSRGEKSKKSTGESRENSGSTENKTSSPNAQANSNPGNTATEARETAIEKDVHSGNHSEAVSEDELDIRHIQTANN